MSYRLGKWPYRHSPKTLRLSKYLTSDAGLQIPESLDLTTKVKEPFPLDGNSDYGDCTCAAAAHLIQVWSALVGDEIVPSQADVEKMYFTITGGPDAGADERTVLEYWSKNPLAGWAPAAFVACDPNDPLHLKAAASLFGGVYIGIQMPKTAMTQFIAGEPWDLVNPGSPDSQPGSLGGHAVNVVSYGPEGLQVVTWGKVQKVTWAFWAGCVDEVWSLLPNDWQKMRGIDWNLLEHDLSLVRE